MPKETKKLKERNGGSDFYLDEGLKEKLESMWEEPAENEIDVIHKVNRYSKNEIW